MTQTRRAWCAAFAKKVQEAFPGRVCFVGIQGSHRRGEATEHSDIDMVVILDKLEMRDLQIYQALVLALPEREKMCGFISGKGELANWPQADLFQFYYDTEPVLGALEEMIALPSREDAGQALKVGAANLYHAACHCYLFEKDKGATLAALYKGVFFLLQAWVFYRNGIYCSNRKELESYLERDEKWLLQTNLAREQIQTADDARLEVCFERLISWCGEKIAAVR